jgi:hypothetical protein
MSRCRVKNGTLSARDEGVDYRHRLRLRLHVGRRDGRRTGRLIADDRDDARSALLVRTAAPTAFAWRCSDRPAFAHVVALRSWSGDRCLGWWGRRRDARHRRWGLGRRGGGGRRVSGWGRCLLAVNLSGLIARIGDGHLGVGLRFLLERRCVVAARVGRRRRLRDRPRVEWEVGRVPAWIGLGAQCRVAALNLLRHSRALGPAGRAPGRPRRRARRPMSRAAQRRVPPSPAA